jgi:NAD(P)H dehydrogenase (quinone)
MIISKVLVLYYSSYGHIEAMANAVAEGARQAGAHVDIKRVPELVPEKIARKSHYKLDQAAPIAKIEDLAAYDAIILGASTRFGRLPSQMTNFLDQAGGFGCAEHCTAKSAARLRRPPRNMAGRRRRCSRSSPISRISAWWLWASTTALDEITGGSPYGATTIAGADGSRRPTQMSYRERAARAARSLRPQTSCTADSRLGSLGGRARFSGSSQAHH